MTLRLRPLVAAPFAAAAAWMAYSRLAVDHNLPLPHALPGERYDLEPAAGRISLYRDGPEAGTPLLLAHSINAAANAYEVRPLFLHFRERRPVYAIDLPGFGFSERKDRTYTPRIMADALHAAVADIRRRHAGQRVDVMALSVSCEYAARAALEQPDDYNSLGFISPTGFDSTLSGSDTAQSTKGSPLRRQIFSVPLWSQALYDLVTTKPSMRFFLEKTWGSKHIDEALLAYDYLSAHQPGAQHAVWSFLSGYLFAADISRIYDLLRLPVWVVHGTRGDFVDYRHLPEVVGKPNWTVDVLDTGAFPQFEDVEATVAAYERFLNAQNPQRLAAS